MLSKIILANNDQMFNVVNAHLSKGWILHPGIYDGKPCRLENAIVYHILYPETKEDESLISGLSIGFDSKPVEPELKIIDVITVPLEDPEKGNKSHVEQRTEEGYEVQQVFSKNVVMVKREEVKQNDEEGKGNETE